MFREQGVSISVVSCLFISFHLVGKTRCCWYTVVNCQFYVEIDWGIELSLKLKYSGSTLNWTMAVQVETLLIMKCQMKCKITAQTLRF